MNYNSLPEGDEYIEKRNRNQAKKLHADPARLIAQYKFEDLSMVIYDWNGCEYEEPYVIMIHAGEIDQHSLHRPEFHSGIYSPDTVIKCINAFINHRSNYIRSDKNHKVPNQIRSYINNEPWDSLEEYKKEVHESAREERNEQKEKELRELHESAREEFEREKELRELHESAREEWDEEKELRELHELAREEWNDEKRSRRIIEELEVNKHEYNIPKMPEVPEEIDEIHCRYTNGDITLIEMQREIENAMSNT